MLRRHLSPVFLLGAVLAATAVLGGCDSLTSQSPTPEPETSSPAATASSSAKTNQASESGPKAVLDSKHGQQRKSFASVEKYHERLREVKKKKASVRVHPDLYNRLKHEHSAAMISLLDRSGKITTGGYVYHVTPKAIYNRPVDSPDAKKQLVTFYGKDGKADDKERRMLMEHHARGTLGELESYDFKDPETARVYRNMVGGGEISPNRICAPGEQPPGCDPPPPDDGGDDGDSGSGGGGDDDDDNLTETECNNIGDDSDCAYFGPLVADVVTTFEHPDDEGATCPGGCNHEVALRMLNQSYGYFDKEASAYSQLGFSPEGSSEWYGSYYGQYSVLDDFDGEGGETFNTKVIVAGGPNGEPDYVITDVGNTTILTKGRGSLEADATAERESNIGAESDHMASTNLEDCDDTNTLPCMENLNGNFRTGNEFTQTGEIGYATRRFYNGRNVEGFFTPQFRVDGEHLLVKAQHLN